MKQGLCKSILSLCAFVAIFFVNSLFAAEKAKKEESLTTPQTTTEQISSEIEKDANVEEEQQEELSGEESEGVQVQEEQEGKEEETELGSAPVAVKEGLGAEENIISEEEGDDEAAISDGPIAFNDRSLELASDEEDDEELD